MIWFNLQNKFGILRYANLSACFVHRRFRRGFAQFFFWCPWVRVTTEPSLSRSEAVTSRYSCTGSPDMHTRISRNGTSSCTISEHACDTGSTTPKNESQPHPEHANQARRNVQASLIDLCNLTPNVIVDNVDDDGVVVTSRNCTSYTDYREIPCKLTHSDLENI